MNTMETFEFVSLVLTVPTLGLAAWVLWIFGPAACKTLSDLLSHPDMVATERLLVLGITFGFVGAFVDNLYWGVAWLSAYLDWPTSPWWFANGVIPNIVFRQGAGVLAAALHIYAHTRGRTDQSTHLVSLIGAATLLSAALLLAWLP